MSSGNWMRYLKKIKPYTIKKGIRYLKHYGPKEFWVRLCAVSYTHLRAHET